MAHSSDQYYRLLIKGVKDYAIFMVDCEGTVLNWNEGARQAKGYTEDEIVGRNYDIFYSADDRAAGLPQRNLNNALSQGREALEGWRYRKDGTRFWASITIDPIYDHHGMFVGFAKITRDMTDHHELVSQLKYSSTHDPLTGILNRAGFFQRLGMEIINQRTMTIFSVDLDHFKPINDRYGHAVGDTVLKAVGERLADRLNMDFVGRLGGDEFVAVQCFKPDPKAAIETGLAIVDTIRLPIAFGSQHVTVGASVGIAYAAEAGDKIDMLLARADVALYQAKVSGRDAVHLFGDKTGSNPKSRRYRKNLSP